MPSIVCARCGAANPEGSRFCAQCGTPLGQAGDSGQTGAGPTGPGYTAGSRPGGERAGETTSMIFTGADLADLEFGDEPPADQDAAGTLPPGTALLVVRRGPNAGSRFLLDSEYTEVGRRPDSDIFLDDVTVSRRHAEFVRQSGRFAVRDVGSLNGTYVNRQRIEEQALTGGDEVQIGKFRLVFLQDPRPPAESGW